MQSKKILVTGGSGFIGTHLCRALLARGHSVRVLDLVPAKTPVDGVEYRIGDVRSRADLENAMSGVQAVYHFAALVSVAYCQEHLAEGFQTNLLATTLVLETLEAESARQGIKIRLIFAGSSAVYGNSGKLGHWISETAPEYAPVDPQSYYAGQKLGSEQAMRIFHRSTGLPMVVFRFFNVYGPGQDPSSPYSGVISIFRKRALEGGLLRLNGGGHQTRDFVSVHDVARANALALELAESSCDGTPINLGTAKSVTIRTLAEEMGRIAGKPIPVEDAPWRDGDVLHSQADISRARTVLGWSPQVTLAEGLKELLLTTQ